MKVLDLPQRVLLVDDFEPWRNWVRAKLAHTQFRIVAEAADGLEAVEKIRELKPDVALLDIGLPDISGIEVAKRIRRTERGCKVVFVTLNSDSAVEAAALATGATAFVLKGFAARDLIPALEAATNGVPQLTNRESDKRV